MSDGEKMMHQREAGDNLSALCLSLYALHLKVPQDQAARGLFEAAYADWKRREYEVRYGLARRPADV